MNSAVVHPLAWWAWAVGVAAFASQTTNPWLTSLAIAVTILVTLARRGDHPWAAAFRLYLIAGAVIVAVRLAFRVLLGSAAGGHVLVDLPQIPLPDWVLGIHLLGPVTSESLLFGLYDGLRLAAIVIAVGAANALANPKKLLRTLPPALYELGTALVVALTVLPQLADSLARVRRAQLLREGDSSRGGRLRRVVVPVLEDALERSMALAAGMDTRGYGRSAGASRRERWITGALMLVGLFGLCVGAYALLDPTVMNGTLAGLTVAVGLAVCVLGLVSAGGRVARTTYRPQRVRGHDVGLVATGLVVGFAGWWVAHHDTVVAHPLVTVAPTLSLTAMIAILIALAPLVLVPSPVADAVEVPA
ncbi:energy-coupling factor transporter transmembrane component T [Nocardioides sp.]|uniref:energy-coupling factor transporter transmembrane component T n=1 Tax=Nocardioides sp. TaxID=35761 RepID=UPI0026029104|nr:energy-coupling factor transporter transmembrane component T [Nocardioides sp.]